MGAVICLCNSDKRACRHSHQKHNQESVSFEIQLIVLDAPYRKGECWPNSRAPQRMRIDYRRLNEKLIRDRYPLPIIIDMLSKAKLLTSLNLIFSHEDSRKYTAFLKPSGQYEFLRVPFGLYVSPSVFQRFINTIFNNTIELFQQTTRANRSYDRRSCCNWRSAMDCA